MLAYFCIGTVFSVTPSSVDVLNCLPSAELLAPVFELKLDRLDAGHEEEAAENAVRTELVERAVVDPLLSQLEWLDKASLVFFARFVAGGELPAGTDSKA